MQTGLAGRRDLRGVRQQNPSSGVPSLQNMLTSASTAKWTALAMESKASSNSRSVQLWDCTLAGRLQSDVHSSLLPDLISLDTVSNAIFCTPASTSLIRSTMSSKFCLTARSCR